MERQKDFACWLENEKTEWTKHDYMTQEIPTGLIVFDSYDERKVVWNTQLYDTLAPSFEEVDSLYTYSVTFNDSDSEKISYFIDFKYAGYYFRFRFTKTMSFTRTVVYSDTNDYGIMLEFKKLNGTLLKTIYDKLEKVTVALLNLPQHRLKILLNEMKSEVENKGTFFKQPIIAKLNHHKI